MKIIGKTEDGFILSAKGSEISKLISYDYTYDMYPKLQIGQEINVSEMYAQLYGLKQFDSDNKYAIAKLECMINSLRLTKPIL